MDDKTDIALINQRMLLRAAVLSCFDVAWIIDDEYDDTVYEQIDRLLFYCERTVDKDGRPYWTLTDGPRIRVFGEKTKIELWQALNETKKRPDDSFQNALTKYLQESTVSVSTASTDELHGLLQLIRWFGSLHGDLPTTEDVRSELQRREFTDPLMSLLTSGFVGRRDLEVRLKAHLLNDDGLPCLVFGPGGVGKSTVAANMFVGDWKEFSYQRAYLNFDKGKLANANNHTIIDEIVRQIALFSPERVNQYRVREFRNNLKKRMSETPKEMGFSSQSVSYDEHVDPEIIEQMANVIEGESLGSISGNTLILFDTFEQVQRRDISHTYRVYELIKNIRKRIPSVRFIIFGRAPIDEELPIVKWHLRDIERPEAITLLRRVTESAEIRRETIEEVIDLVGCNPLSIRLAGDILLREGHHPLRNLQITEKQIQGQLYSRILDHIRNPDVRSIAHPGLVVRRITPEIIREILAGPCGIDIQEPSAADRLFEALRKEATLMEESPEGDGALVHRTDVRALMLKAIHKTQRGKARQIHRLAVRYYQKHATEKSARREELYHRLMLGHAPSTLNRRWDPGAGEEVALAIDELPVGSQVYLATKVDIRVPKAIREAANDQDWAAAVESSVRGLIESENPQEALDVIRERRGFGGKSLLPELEIEALEAVGELDEAVVLSESELKHAVDAADHDATRNLSLHNARILERKGEFDSAFDRLDQLVTVGKARRERLEDEQDIINELSLLASWLRLARRIRHNENNAESIRLEAVELSDRLPSSILTRQTDLIRELSGELGDLSPTITRVSARLREQNTGILRMPSQVDQRIRDEDQSLSSQSDTDSALWSNWPAPAGSRFVGREENMATLHKFVESYRFVVVTGLAGSGKSRLVTEFGHRNFNPSKRYWCTSGTDVESTLINLAESLDVPITERSEREIAEEVSSILRDLHADSLVVFDNISDSSQIMSLVGTCGDAKVIFTSNQISVDDIPGNGINLEVGPLDSQSARELIQYYVPKQSGQISTKLLENLQYLAPLTVSLIASTIASTLGPSVPLANILAIIAKLIAEKNSPDNRVLKSINNASTTTHNDVFAVLKLALDSLSPESRRHIESFGYLADYPVSTEFGSVLTDVKTSAELREVIEILRARNLASEEDESEIRIHVLVQDGIRATNPSGALEKTVNRVAERIRNQLAHASDIGTLKRELVHYRAVLKYADESENINTVAAIRLALGISNVLLLLGRSGEASTLLESTLRNGGADESIPESVIMTIAENMVIAYEYGGRLEEAIKIREQLNERQAQLLDRDNPALINGLVNLSNLYRSVGRGMEASDTLDLAIELSTSITELDAPETWVIFGTLATALSGIGKYQEALAILEEIRATSEKRLPPGHPILMSVMNNIAVAYSLLDRLREALSLFEEILVRRSQSLGPEHPDTLRSTSNLASAYRMIGRIDEAIEIDRRVLEMQRSLLGPLHPDVLRSRSKLASDLVTAGLSSEALKLDRETLTLCAESLGDYHPLTVRTRQNIDALENSSLWDVRPLGPSFETIWDRGRFS